MGTIVTTRAWRVAPWQVLNWLAGCIRKDRIRAPLWLPAALASGIAFYFVLPFEPPWPTAVVAAGGAVVVGALSLTVSANVLRMAFALLAAALLGFSLAKLREESVAAPVLRLPVGPVQIDGMVDYAQVHGMGIRVLISDVQSPRFLIEDGPHRVRVSFRHGAEMLQPGDRIHATVVLMPPPGPSEPDAYDFGRAAFFERIGAVGYAYGEPVITAKAPHSVFDLGIGEAIAQLRAAMTQRIRSVLQGSTGSIATALITGDRGGISESDESALRDAGLAHVLAIAGLHMALVGLGLFWVIRAVLAGIPRVALNYPIKKWAALAALGGATFYLIISGAGAPTIRAYTMLSMMLLAVLFDRPALSMRSVALAATIILVLEPESLIEPGFQMSFAAVVGLIAVAEWEQARAARRDPMSPKRLPGVRRYVRGIVTTSFVGSMATLPYAVFHFDRATHYSVLGNLLAMPIMGFVTMPAAALSVVAMPFGLEAWPLRAMGWGIDAMLGVGRWVSNLPGATSVVAAWPMPALVLISLGGLWCTIWRYGWRWLGLVPMAVGLWLALTAKGPDLLVGRDGTTIAVRGSNGALRLVRPTRDSYSANDWLKRDGDEREAGEAVAGPQDGVHCDAEGCIAQGRGGMTIAAPARADAFAEDCARATIVISAVQFEDPCVGPRLVLSRKGIARAGGYAIWLSPLKVVSVQSERGERPWSVGSDALDDDQ